MPDSKLQRIAQHMRKTGEDRTRIQHRERLRLMAQRTIYLQEPPVAPASPASRMDEGVLETTR